MSEPSPTLAHAEAHARRELDYMQSRFSSGNVSHEQLGKLRWKIACQQLVVAELAKLNGDPRAKEPT